MSTIKTKYSLKQKVYYAWCKHSPYLVECGDCDGTGYWAVEGKDRKIGCHTCNKENSWYNTPGKVTEYKHFPCVDELTIGQIQAILGHEAQVRYMCKETGLGSGTLWPENQLTVSEDTAKEAARILAEQKNAGNEVKVEEIYIQLGEK